MGDTKLLQRCREFDSHKRKQTLWYFVSFSLLSLHVAWLLHAAAKPSSRLCAHGPHRLVVRTSRCGRDNPGSTPGVDIWLRQETGRTHTHAHTHTSSCRAPKFQLLHPAGAPRCDHDYRLVLCTRPSLSVSIWINQDSNKWTCKFTIQM